MRSTALGNKCETPLEDFGCTPIYECPPPLSFNCVSSESFWEPPIWAIDTWTHRHLSPCSGLTVSGTPGVFSPGQNSAGPLLCRIFIPRFQVLNLSILSLQHLLWEGKWTGTPRFQRRQRTWSLRRLLDGCTAPWMLGRWRCAERRTLQCRVHEQSSSGWIIHVAHGQLLRIPYRWPKESLSQVLSAAFCLFPEATETDSFFSAAASCLQCSIA